MSKLPPLPHNYDEGWGVEATGETWDPELADAIVGAVLLVGITYMNADGTVDRHDQLYGTIARADRRGGILLNLAGLRQGQSWNMPPETRALSPASPGDYQLRSTGEVVTDPDYTAVWTLRKPTTS